MKEHRGKKGEQIPGERINSKACNAREGGGSVSMTEMCGLRATYWSPVQKEVDGGCVDVVICHGIVADWRKCQPKQRLVERKQ